MGNRYSDISRELKFLRWIGTDTALIVLMIQHKEDGLTNFSVYIGITTIQGKHRINAVLGTHIPALGRSFLFESVVTWASFLCALVGC